MPFPDQVKITLWLIMVLLSGCDTYQSKDIDGLWQLEKFQQDGFIKKFEPTYLEINDNRTFGVSRTSRDISGVYKLQKNILQFYSDDRSWFSKEWSLTIIDGKIQLQGIEKGLGNVILRFGRIEKMPDYHEQEESVIGKWQLYKIRKEGKSVQHLSNTWFLIREDGSYDIIDDQGQLEHGEMMINFRHQKMVFENKNTVWNIFHYGSELRLTNDKMKLQYCLRRAE